MTTPAFAFLFAGVLLNAAAQLLLKGGTNRLGVITLTTDNWPAMLWRMATEGLFVAGIACYVVNAIAAHYLFGEAVTAQRWLGIGFIIIGVWLVARS